MIGAGVGYSHVSRQSVSKEREFTVVLSDCARNPKQRAFIDCQTKRIIVRAGRRGGKTRGVSERAVKRFLQGRRQLYAAPTQEQVESFWFAVCQMLSPLIVGNVLKKNESEHTIERPGTKQRIKAKTAWNADTLRGDYADDLILDEWQLMNEDAWQVVGAPMLLDNNGDAVFIYTPPSLHAQRRFVSKANDPLHAAKMYKKAVAEMAAKGELSRWAVFYWSSRDNGYISAEALEEIAQDMTSLDYRMEIEAEDIEDAPGALWTREMIEKSRLDERLRKDRVTLPFERVVVGVDPTGTSTGDEAGIVPAGKIGPDFYPLDDYSLQGRPNEWAQRAVDAYNDYEADCIVAESNYGGEMVESTIHMIDPGVPVKLVTATRGKAVRADPISALYEKGHGHHIGTLPKLENEMCMWIPGTGAKSPNRMDALVWAGTDLMLGNAGAIIDAYAQMVAADKAKKADAVKGDVQVHGGLVTRVRQGL